MKPGWVAFVLAAVAACAGPRELTKPNDSSAAEHHRAANREGELAAREADRYLSRSLSPGSPPPAPVPRNDFKRTVPMDDLPAGPLAEAEKHRALARRHEAAARYLEENEEAECRGVPRAARAACPLLGAVDRVEDVRGGIRFSFSAATPVEAVLARMRCHYAYQQARAFAGSESCPLYGRAVDIRRGLDPLAIEITTSDSSAVGARRRHAREEVGFVPVLGDAAR